MKRETIETVHMWLSGKKEVNIQEVGCYVYFGHANPVGLTFQSIMIENAVTIHNESCGSLNECIAHFYLFVFYSACAGAVCACVVDLNAALHAVSGVAVDCL